MFSNALAYLLLALLGGASALPGRGPMITEAPSAKDAYPTEKQCTSEACFYSYSECNGQMSFITNCFTPCGTATAPPPYICPAPPPTTEAPLTTTEVYHTTPLPPTTTLLVHTTMLPSTTELPPIPEPPATTAYPTTAAPAAPSDESGWEFEASIRLPWTTLTISLF
ncbi:hypothetical protein F4780DRAFT_409208 [Xylariomycetidae sp. FL0641]|nr:hypothetical protein F4780DRAFT_409208 [Xylariomycetidae sp. FL0641]